MEEYRSVKRCWSRDWKLENRKWERRKCRRTSGPLHRGGTSSTLNGGLRVRDWHKVSVPFESEEQSWGRVSLRARLIPY
jgi:hypothetical protein